MNLSVTSATQTCAQGLHAAAAVASSDGYLGLAADFDRLALVLLALPVSDGARIADALLSSPSPEEPDSASRGTR